MAGGIQRREEIPQCFLGLVILLRQYVIAPQPLT